MADRIETRIAPVTITRHDDGKFSVAIGDPVDLWRSEPPQDTDPVLVSSSKEGVTIAYYHGGWWWRVSGGSLTHVTHWMPLPKGPR